MKRKTVQSYEVFRTYLPFSWKRCAKCGYEFRREFGWKAVTGPHHGLNGGVLRYLCGFCAPSKSDAIEFFLNTEWYPLKPLPPSAPPSRKKFISVNI